MTVRHSRGSYDIKFVSLDDAARELPADSFVITDERVSSLYGPAFGRPSFAVPEGEASKSFQCLESVLEWLVTQGANRQSTLVALGGGVVGDLVGFAAAIFMRGVRLIQVPTTLLAQVDSSVGGKAGIDLKSGKNLAGAFWPPLEVRVPVETLATLSERQFQNGLAEVWKYGLILEAGLFEELARNPLASDDARLEQVVKRCIQLKASVVAEDEFEVTGRRAILNFGHTIGHAIEHVTGYGPILHGEAIAAGMIFETKLGELLGVTPRGTFERVASALSGLAPPREQWAADVNGLLSAMKRDKKSTDGQLAFSLLTDIGACRLVRDVSEVDVRAVLNEG